MLNAKLLSGSFVVLGASCSIPLLTFGESGSSFQDEKKAQVPLAKQQENNLIGQSEECKGTSQSETEKDGSCQKWDILSYGKEDIKNKTQSGVITLGMKIDEEMRSDPKPEEKDIGKRSLAILECGWKGEDISEIICKDVTTQWFYLILKVQDQEFYLVVKRDSGISVAGENGKIEQSAAKTWLQSKEQIKDVLKKVTWSEWGQKEMPFGKEILNGQCWSFSGGWWYPKWGGGGGNSCSGGGERYDSNMKMVGATNWRYHDGNGRARYGIGNNSDVHSRIDENSLLDSFEWSLIDISRYTFSKSENNHIWKPKFTPKLLKN